MEEMVTEEFKADKNLKYSEKLKRQGQCNVLILRSFIADVYKAAKRHNGFGFSQGEGSPLKTPYWFFLKY
jgi:hypothetical protein